MGEFTSFVLLCGFVSAIIWLVIGWRAMRAHERLADAAAEWVERGRPPRVPHPNFPSARSARMQPPTPTPPGS